MVEEIVPGLYRLSIPMTAGGVGWTTPYVFRGADGLTLFDTGYGTHGATEALTAQLAELGHTPREVRRVLASHAHSDHLGMVKWLKDQSPGCELVMIGQERLPFGPGHRNREDSDRQYNAWALMHGLDLEAIEETEEGLMRTARDQSERALDRELASGRVDTATATERNAALLGRFEPDVRLHDGDEYVFDGWRLRAVWTPGHTTGHLCMYDEERRLMFTGDHVLSRITPNVSVGPEDEAIARSPLREFRESLEKVARFDTVRALPAHQDTIDDLPARCLAILEHHDERLEEVHIAIGAGRRSAADVAAGVEWSHPYETFSRYKRRAAMGETLSHLQVLVEDGRARRIETDSHVFWEQT